MKKSKPQSKQRKARPQITECYFTQTGTTPDYKDILTLKRFTSDRGKLLPRKYTGICAKHQRTLSKEVKKARFMALLHYTDQHLI